MSVFLSFSNLAPRAEPTDLFKNSHSEVHLYRQSLPLSLCARSFITGSNYYESNNRGRHARKVSRKSDRRSSERVACVRKIAFSGRGAGARCVCP